MARARYKAEEIQIPEQFSRGGRQVFGVFRTELIARTDSAEQAEKIARMFNDNEQVAREMANLTETRRQE